MVSSIIENCFVNLDIGGHTEKGKRIQIELNQPKILIEKSKTTKYYVATINETIVGICGYGDGEVRTLFIDINHHGKGFGKALLAKVIADAQKDGLTKLFTWSTLFAERLYSSFGFEKTREILVLEDSRDIVLIEMILNLT